MRSRSAVEPQGNNKLEPHARNRKTFYHTHGTVKGSTARKERTESQKSQPRARISSGCAGGLAVAVQP